MLMEQSLKIDAGEKLDAIAISSAPHMESKSRKRLVLDLETATKDVDEIFSTGDTNAVDKMKRIMK